MTYNIGEHISFEAEPIEERQSMEWLVGQRVDFLQVADEPRIFLPKLTRSYA